MNPRRWIVSVIDKHRIIKDCWIYSICENCGTNPEKVEMVKEFLVSGDPEKKCKSKKEIWVCPHCGYTRRL